MNFTPSGFISVVCCLWSVVCGLLSVVCYLWSVICGVLYLICGPLATDHSYQQTANSEQFIQVLKIGDCLLICVNLLHLCYLRSKK